MHGYLRRLRFLSRKQFLCFLFSLYNKSTVISTICAVGKVTNRDKSYHKYSIETALKLQYDFFQAVQVFGTLLYYYT